MATNKEKMDAEIAKAAKDNESDAPEKPEYFVESMSQPKEKSVTEKKQEEAENVRYVGALVCRLVLFCSLLACHWALMSRPLPRTIDTVSSTLLLVGLDIVLPHIAADPLRLCFFSCAGPSQSPGIPGACIQEEAQDAQTDQ